MKFLRSLTLTRRLAVTFTVLILMFSSGFMFVVHSLQSVENSLQQETKTHLELLSLNTEVSRQVFSISTKLQLLERTFAHSKTVLTQNSIDISRQLEQIRQLSDNQEFDKSVDSFILAFQAFLANSRALTQEVAALNTIDTLIGKQIDKLDLLVTENDLKSYIEHKNTLSSHTFAPTDMLMQSYLSLGKKLGTLSQSSDTRTAEILLIDVKNEIAILRLLLNNIAPINRAIADQKVTIARALTTYEGLLDSVNRLIEKRSDNTQALLNSQARLLTLVNRTEDKVKSNAIALTTRIERALDNSQYLTLFLTLISVVIGLMILTALIQRHVREPLKRLTFGFSYLERSSFTQRIHLGRQDEWADIEHAFNNMADRIEATYHQLEKEKRNFDYLAHHDTLTSLANRLLATDQLKEQIAHATSLNRSFVVIYLDIDNFKTINDSLGHSIGDQLLVDVSRSLQSTVDGDGIVARMGGDEFFVILNTDKTIQQALSLCETINRNLRRPYQIDGRTLLVSSSIGVCQFPNHGNDVDTLIRNADTAMYQAKRQGRDQTCIYDPELTHAANTLIDVSSGIREAIEASQFEIHFQPQISSTSKEAVGAEALLRWPHPTYGYLDPLSFLSIAEQTGQIVDINRWVFARVVRLMDEWHDAGLLPDSMVISINLSARQFFSPDLVDELQSVLAGTSIRPAQICLELTEREMMTGIKAGIETTKRLRDLGYRIAIDDFGTGFSSLALLKELDVDVIKLDKSFIVETHSSKKDLEIVRSVMMLAKPLGLTVVAEGVEHQEQEMALSSIGCHVIQGYYYSKPLSIVDWEAYLKTNQS